MERFNSVKALNYALVLSAAFLVSSVTQIQPCHAITASYGQPYHGRLVDGIPFPTQFPGYQVREESRTYTTPEVIGAMLDAIEAVRTQFPDTCDIYLGDFSTPSGGSAIHHRSHQNGRDVDVGMYAKGNRPLDQLVPMNEDNLDAAKTWCLIENIIRSQRVQYIFLDRSVQRILYNYASKQGYDQAYLDRIFGNVRGSLVQHVRNHVDHFHVRFFTPWSTLAAHIGGGEMEKRMVIEMAQQSYLPKRVNYYVKDTDHNLDSLAQSFGVAKRDLCKWNKLNPSTVPVPGSCLVFFKRSFESEPVHLARSLQPGFIAEAPPIQMASLRTAPPEPTVSDVTGEPPEPKVQKVQEKHSEPVAPKVVYTAKRGDTLDKIARRNHMDVKLLCQLNGISKTTPLRAGQTIKTSRMLADRGETVAMDASKKKGGSSTAICFASDPKKPDSPTAAYYTVGKGDTLQHISRKSGIPIDSLCQLNSLKRNSTLMPGQKIKLTQESLPVKPNLGKAACPPGKAGKAPAVKGKDASGAAAPAAKSAKTAKAEPHKAALKDAPARSASKAVEVKSNSKVTAKVAPQPKPAMSKAASGTTVQKAAAKPEKPAQKKAAEAKADKKPAAQLAKSAKK